MLRIKRFCGILVGFVFFLSGIVKLMDPVGAGLVMKEYYEFLYIGFMDPTAKIFGVVIAMAETLIGAGLIIGVWKKIVALTALGVQGFFTIITLFLVIFNPEMDCGCFGEAIHLTHMETFVKNLILLAFLCIYTFPLIYLGATRKRKYVSFALVACSVLAFTIYSWINIPLIDFTDYKAGAVLKAANAENTDEIYGNSKYIYEKDGIRQSFDLLEIPDDSTWVYVGVEENINTSAMLNTIELPIRDIDTEEDMDIVATEGKVLVTSVYDTDLTSDEWTEIMDFQKMAFGAGYKPVLLISSKENVPESIKSQAYLSDYKTLITLNRSNAGVTYFNEGVLICKWAERKAPDQKELHKLSSLEPEEAFVEYDNGGNVGMQGFLLYVFAVMLLL